MTGVSGDSNAAMAVWGKTDRDWLACVVSIFTFPAALWLICSTVGWSPAAKGDRRLASGNDGVHGVDGTSEPDFTGPDLRAPAGQQKVFAGGYNTRHEIDTPRFATGNFRLIGSSQKQQAD